MSTEPTTALLPTEASATAALKKPFVVCVSGIPPLPDDGDAIRVRAWVESTIARLSNDKSDFISDMTIVPSCTAIDSFVALVDFKLLPEFFSFLKKGTSRVCKVPDQDGCYLEFSPGFVGFTQMYSTASKPTAE